MKEHLSGPSGTITPADPHPAPECPLNDDRPAAAMTVVELVTGVRLTGEWLAEAHPYVTFRWPLAPEPLV